MSCYNLRTCKIPVALTPLILINYLMFIPSFCSLTNEIMQSDDELVGSYDHFGYSVDMHNNYIAVGSPNYHTYTPSINNIYLALDEI